MIKVLVSGFGKMGREVLSAVAQQPDMEAGGCVDGLSHEEWISVPGVGELQPFGGDEPWWKLGDFERVLCFSE